MIWQKRLLAINFGGIGDEILFLPTLKTIKEYHPDWHLTLLVEPRSKSIEQVTNLIDRTITFDIKKRPLLLSDLLTLVALLRDGDYDLVISSGSTPLVSILLWLSGIRFKIGYNSGLLSQVFLNSQVALCSNQYAAAMYHDLVSGLQIQAQHSLPELMVAEDSRKTMTDLLVQQGVSKAPVKIVIHPGTSRLAIEKGIVKTWPAKCSAQLIASLAVIKDVAVILVGGPDDEVIVNDILELTKPGQCVSAYKQTKNLADLVALIDLCDLLVCVDSAPMHIGVGLRKPLVALFGPTDPKHLLPADPKFKILRHENGNLESSGVCVEPAVVLEGVLSQLPLK